MIKKTILYIAAILFFQVTVSGQEVITGLQHDRLLNTTLELRSGTKGPPADTLSLPFFDDFSNQSYSPDQTKWSDNTVFINNTYSDQQITAGMATLDALDAGGRLYESASPAVFKADSLTSQPIDLNFPASQDIYLSFFYEPGGLADIPETNDSLAMHFFAPDEDKWYSVWKTPGGPQDGFKPVIIRIDQSRYLKKGFRFRFINYASLSPNLNDPSMTGNCDQWNLDYIFLDINRNEADTIFPDVAFRLPLRSLLKTYEAMPWEQFRQVYLREMGSSIPVSYRNNDTIIRNVTRLFEIRDLYTGSIVHEFSAGATNVTPLTNINYDANLIYTFNPANNDSALFRITASLKTDEFDPKANDTLKYDQVFGNYFAFDDGSSEGGYGINGLGSGNAMVAYRFESFTEDTIRAISICFNDSYLNANKRLFDLMIWDDVNDLPGNVIYSLEEVMVDQGEEINGFYTYLLPDGVMVDDVFYVGWKQRSETFLNAGFDINTPNTGRQFYWLNGYWYSSQVPGSIMIRPVTGPPLKTTSVEETLAGTRNSLRLWPNPASDYLKIDAGDLPLSGSVYISFLDFYGRELMRVPYSEIIDISSLHEGIYIVITGNGDKPVGYNRLVITR